jgi:hypothetical protein
MQHTTLRMTGNVTRMRSPRYEMRSSEAPDSALAEEDLVVQIKRAS